MSLDSFATGMDYLLERAVWIGMNGISFGDHSYTDLDFANDVCLLTELMELLVPVLEALAIEAESLGLEVNWHKTMLQALSNILDVPPTVTVLEQEVSTVEEFVYLGALIHSSTHSFPDIMRRSAFTHTAMQSLVNQLWWSRIALSTKLRLYNICIVYITYNICIYYICCNIYMCVYCRYFPVRVKSAGRLPYQGRCTQDQCPPSMVSVCFSASSGITSSPMMKFGDRPTNLYLRKLSRHSV